MLGTPNRSYILEINGLPIRVIPKKIKNLYLRICAKTGDILMSVPQKTNLTAIHAMIKTNVAWIEQQQIIHAKYASTEDICYYLGQKYILDYQVSLDRPKIILHHDQDQTMRLLVKVNKHMTQIARVDLFNKWYRDQFKKILPAIIHQWEIKTGLTVLQYGIKDMKTRWGSCNPEAKRIWLSLELIKRPIHCIEYVVLHEIVHFLECSHNHRFKSLMTHFMPDWRRINNELKTPIG